MAAFVAKQMVGNKLNAVKGMFASQKLYNRFIQAELIVTQAIPVDGNLQTIEVRNRIFFSTYIKKT